MEIRTLERKERAVLVELLSDWALAEAWQAGERFERIVESDPDYSDDNVFIATDRGEIVGCAQIFPRRVRILGHSIPAAGIGNLYSRSDSRGGGVATSLLEHATQVMRERGIELALLFSDGAPPGFFEKRGWQAWRGQRTILRQEDAPRLVDDDGIALSQLDPSQDRALGSIKAIYTAYGSTRSGSVIRDDALWTATFELAPPPQEEIWIARRGGLAVAYARAALVGNVLTITELGRFEDGADPLAKLIASFLVPRDPDPLAIGTTTSRDLRAFVVLPAFDDIGLTVALEHRGVSSHPMDDDSAMIYCVNLTEFASRLDVDLLPDEDGGAFLHRILPPDGMVFWPSDRF